MPIISQSAFSTAHLNTCNFLKTQTGYCTLQEHCFWQKQNKPKKKTQTQLYFKFNPL